MVRTPIIETILWFPLESQRLIKGVHCVWKKGTTMPGGVRLDIYRKQNHGHKLTAKQRRRYRHKVNAWTSGL